MEEIKLLWKDRRRHFGLPLSFTKYRLSENRIFCERGLLNLHEEEILLYRVRDLELKRTLGQRIFGVGTVVIHSSDKTMPILELQNIRQPREVKELLYRQVEESKDARRMRAMEFVGNEHSCQHEGTEDGEPDFEDMDD